MCFVASNWGRNITTSTGVFAGTSGATAITAGIIANIQSMAKARGKSPYTSREIRTILRATGKAVSGKPVGNAVYTPDLINRVLNKNN